MLATLAAFAACTAETTDFDDSPATGGSGGSAGSSSVAGSAGSAGSASTGGTSGSGGRNAGGSAGSLSVGGEAGEGGHAGGQPGGAGGSDGEAGGGGTPSAGAGGEGGGTGGQTGEGGRGEAGHPGAGGVDGDGRGGQDGVGGFDGQGGGDGSGFVCQTSIGTLAQPVVSDLETGQAVAKAPYLGLWQAFFDGGNAAFSVTEEGADASEHAVRLSGSNINFAGITIGLNDDGEHACPHDGSAFDGIRFFYKSTHSLVTEVTSRPTMPPPSGTCSDACFNFHQKTLPAAAHWTLAEVRYSELVQTFGSVAPLVRDELLAIQFTVSGVVTAGVGSSNTIVPSFTFDIDELEFFAD